MTIIPVYVSILTLMPITKTHLELIFIHAPFDSEPDRADSGEVVFFKHGQLWLFRGRRFRRCRVGMPMVLVPVAVCVRVGLSMRPIGR